MVDSHQEMNCHLQSRNQGVSQRYRSKGPRTTTTTLEMLHLVKLPKQAMMIQSLNPEGGVVIGKGAADQVLWSALSQGLKVRSRETSITAGHCNLLYLTECTKSSSPSPALPCRCNGGTFMVPYVCVTANEVPRLVQAAEVAPVVIVSRDFHRVRSSVLRDRVTPQWLRDVERCGEGPIAFGLVKW
jgi:hypothetical protein